MITTLSTPPDLLLARRRARLLDDLAHDANLGRHLAGILVAMVVGAALYGGMLGSWRGGMQTIYAALKLPLVLLLTTAFTLVFNWMSAMLLGLRLRFVQVALLSALALAIAALVLASLTPIIALFTASAPLASENARLTHN